MKVGFTFTLQRVQLGKIDIKDNANTRSLYRVLSSFETRNPERREEK